MRINPIIRSNYNNNYKPLVLQYLQFTLLDVAVK